MGKNIFQLVEESGNKKILVARDTWSKSYAVINTIIPKEKYGKAYGVTHHANGWTRSGEIECAGNYSWRLIDVIDADIVIEECE